nr:class I SAM-dependent methyltransferase [Nitrosomonas nitrosa]
MSNDLTPDQAAFRQFELDGWKTSAPVYFDAIVGVNSQSVPALLDAAGVAAGVRVLDLACGPGHIAAAAAQRGAQVTGLDFSPQMLAQARRRYPGIAFQAGDAEASPLADAGVDAVVMGYALTHIPGLPAGEIGRLADAWVAGRLQVLERCGSRLTASHAGSVEQFGDGIQVLLAMSRPNRALKQIANHRRGRQQRPPHPCRFERVTEVLVRQGNRKQGRITPVGDGSGCNLGHRTCDRKLAKQLRGLMYVDATVGNKVKQLAERRDLNTEQRIHGQLHRHATAGVADPMYRAGAGFQHRTGPIDKVLGAADQMNQRFGLRLGT